MAYSYLHTVNVVRRVNRAAYFLSTFVVDKVNNSKHVNLILKKCAVFSSQFC